MSGHKNNEGSLHPPQLPQSSLKLLSNSRASPKPPAKCFLTPGCLCRVYVPLSASVAIGWPAECFVAHLFSLGLGLHMYIALMSIHMTWFHQYSFIQPLRQQEEVISYSPKISTYSDLKSSSVPAFLAQWSGGDVNVDLKVTSWSVCPNGGPSTSCTAENSSNMHTVLLFHLYLYIFFHFSPYTLVLAAIENNGFVGGFKMSDKENKHLYTHFVVRQGTVLKQQISRSRAAAAVAHPKQ